MNSLSDGMLIEAYVTAKRLNLSFDFILLLEAELVSRNLVEAVGMPSE